MTVKGGRDLVGRGYLLHGVPVTVVCAYGPGCAPALRNVLVEFADGSRTVRPFRGLRRLSTEAPTVHSAPSSPRDPI